MGLVGKFVTFTLVLVIALIAKKYTEISKPLPIPDVDVNAYWGPGEKSHYKEDPKTYLSNVIYEEKYIDELKTRLTQYREYTEPLENTAFQYGFDQNELKKIVNYWNNTYLNSWRQHEIALNLVPHFYTQIQGLRIHYLHAKPKHDVTVPVYPIILLHGWPGSVREFSDIIPLLVHNADKKDFTFEVIAPSLPGYGWSQGSSKPGLSPSEIGVIMRNLMLRLGHKKFYIQGGDWGSLIGGYMAAFFPENVLGYHTNMCGSMSTVANIKTAIASFYPSYFAEEKYVNWFYPYLPILKSMIKESGYFHIQATKPDTIGAALSNNPVGLAAYILEKFSTWTNKNYIDLPDGGLTKNFKLDALLDNVMIYYLTNSITTSQRLYAEAFTAKEFEKELDRIPITVPSACARFKNELAQQVDWAIKDKYTNLIQTTYFEDGGHFAAMQLPDILYKDIVNFVKKIKQ